YAICISTNTGLWRYLLGDTIQFTSINPFRIKVTGRTKHFINAFGEEVIVDNADQAIARACAQTGMQVREYTAAPIYFSNTGNGGHEWLVEFAQLPDDLQYFAQLTDEALQQLNSDYEAKRYKNIAMKPLVMHAVPPGTFYKWLESKGKLGGQHKVPR
ncbi:MAG TPA: GH3 auxin-responsive promoter family protein, partial [Chitinophagales bacterium]|nr:GH3 auxin-responsive promoter family protein [Chitinophagales bacterium]